MMKASFPAMLFKWPSNLLTCIIVHSSWHPVLMNHWNCSFQSCPRLSSYLPSHPFLYLSPRAVFTALIRTRHSLTNALAAFGEWCFYLSKLTHTLMSGCVSHSQLEFFNEINSTDIAAWWSAIQKWSLWAVSGEQKGENGSLDLTTEEVEMMTRRMLYAGHEETSMWHFLGLHMGKDVWADTTEAENTIAVGHKMLWGMVGGRGVALRWSWVPTGHSGSGLKQLPSLCSWRRGRTVALGKRRFKRQWLRFGAFHWCLKAMS